MRELGGRTHAFVHNGDLPGIYRSESLTIGPYRPVGQTDSEHAFCALLARLSALWEADGPPPLDARLSVLTTFAAELRSFGPANFLYADGDALFAHGHRRLQRATRRAEPPGLWTLQRHCTHADPSPDRHGGVSITRGEQAVVLIASVPLTDEVWRPLLEGAIALDAQDGQVPREWPYPS